jgi:hypothetical protein
LEAGKYLCSLPEDILKLKSYENRGHGFWRSGTSFVIQEP